MCKAESNRALQGKRVETWWIGDAKQAGLESGTFYLPGTVGVEDYWYKTGKSGVAPTETVGIRISQQKRLSLRTKISRQLLNIPELAPLISIQTYLT